MISAGNVFADHIPMPATYDVSLVLDVAGEIEKDERLASLRASDVRPLFLRFPADEYREGTCPAARSGFIHVNADGMVEPCPFSHFAADSILQRPYPAVVRYVPASGATYAGILALLARRLSAVRQAQPGGGHRT